MNFHTVNTPCQFYFQYTLSERDKSCCSSSTLPCCSSETCTQFVMLVGLVVRTVLAATATVLSVRGHGLQQGLDVVTELVARLI
eukprot:2048539-Rhodomonas_salina.1